MIRLNNDYNRGAHPELLKALAETNGESYCGYGLDEWCERAAEEIKRHIERPDAAVHFLVGGTQTNYTLISAALRPYQSVISADSGHIHVHETGAVENCGHKIHALSATDGKITAKQIAREAQAYRESGVQEHITQPKLVYISFPTEYGTIYSKRELEEIRAVCDEYGLYLFIDGARMSYGLCAENADVTAIDIAAAADAFYFGGTKCGALFGEALVITRDELKTDFRSYIKQNGAMLAKGWLLGVQFYTLFKGDGLYFEIAKRADRLAMRVKNAFAAKKLPFFVESGTKQQFVVLPNEIMDRLAEKYCFEFEGAVDETHSCVRFCTSWSTDEKEIDELVSDISKL